MQRYLTLLILFLLTIPVGLSIQGCANKNANYCNGAGYGYTNSQPVTITITGTQLLSGVSVGFGQTSQLTQPSAQNCKGSSASVSSYTYGSTDRTIADISPTGAICGGTWNYTTPAVAAYTTCLPSNKQGVAYVTASAAGFTSNQIAVYSHPNLSSILVNGPTDSSGQPICLSQGQTSQLTATAYCTSTGTTGNCPSSTVPTGQSVLLCGGSSATACTNVIGHINYTTSSTGTNTSSTGTTATGANNIVTIDQNGVATAQAPGSTLIYGQISTTGSSSGYWYTCPPQTISLSTSSTGSTTMSLTPNNPQALNAVVTDTQGKVITGLQLTYISTNPTSISVSSAGSVTASFPSSSALTAACEPPSCNPAPINNVGTLNTGVAVTSNSVQATSPGQNSAYIWVASPSSPYFAPIDLSLSSVGNPIKLPYTPNSMVADRQGQSLYFGSYRELMIYNAQTNRLTTETTNVPGVVLAVSPNNTTVVISDQNRGVIYLYTPATTTGTGSTATTTAASFTSFGGIGQRATFSPDGQTVYIVGTSNNVSTLYIHNTYTGWTVQTLAGGTGTPGTGVCPANNSSSYPNDPNTNPPDTPQNPNNSYNTFCSPDLTLTVPTLAAFISGSSATPAYGTCPDSTLAVTQNYALATNGTVNVGTDHLAATTDGKHILGATANPAVLTDAFVTVPTDGNNPAGACPQVNGKTSRTVFNPPPSITQTSLAGYGITNINQVVASTSLNTSSPTATNPPEISFVTYLSNATAQPASGGLPAYLPAAQAGTAGKLSSVKLAGSAIDPISGIFSPDNTLFFVGTTGDNQIHLIDTTTLTDTRQINPGLVDQNGNPTPPVFFAVKPRPTT